MANQEHVDILKQGFGMWNRWRERNSGVIPNLRDAQLQGAKLHRVNLQGADLGGAYLLGANLSIADLMRANLLLARLGEANLQAAKLQGADLQGAKLGYTNIAKNDLSDVKGLESTYHRDYSFLHSTTIIQSKGDIPIEFMRGCGLADWEIEAAKLYRPNLSNNEVIDITYKISDIRTTQAIQVNPLFISYSHADGEYVDRVGGYLTKKGIRYWRDIHHATAGKLEKQIDRAMRLNPTVLLILSENSINSKWVEHEARKAEKLQRELDRDVLCPVALDDSWKDCRWPEWLREQIEDYVILDFSQWKQKDLFNEKFTKLLSGLDLFYKD